MNLKTELILFHDYLICSSTSSSSSKGTIKLKISLTWFISFCKVLYSSEILANSLSKQNDATQLLISFISATISLHCNIKSLIFLANALFTQAWPLLVLSLLPYLLQARLQVSLELKLFNLDITSYMKIHTDIFIFRAGFCEIIITLIFFFVGHIANILWHYLHALKYN